MKDAYSVPHGAGATGPGSNLIILEAVGDSILIFHFSLDKPRRSSSTIKKIRKFIYIILHTP
jgi:hypothetical protein